MNIEYRSSPYTPTCVVSPSLRALACRSHARKASVSWLRHIQVGKRANGSPPPGMRPSATPRTMRSSDATSGQSPSTATIVKPCRSISARVSRARMR